MSPGGIARRFDAGFRSIQLRATSARISHGDHENRRYRAERSILPTHV